MNLAKAFEKLRTANQCVPRSLRLPTEGELNAAQEDIEYVFHSDFRRFQLEVSNVVAGVLEPALVLPNVSTCRDLRQVTRRAWELGVPRAVLPFCHDNGDFHFIDESGQCGFWDHMDQSVVSAGRLADWIVEVWLDEE